MINPINGAVYFGIQMGGYNHPHAFFFPRPSLALDEGMHCLFQRFDKYNIGYSHELEGCENISVLSGSFRALTFLNLVFISEKYAPFSICILLCDMEFLWTPLGVLLCCTVQVRPNIFYLLSTIFSVVSPEKWLSVKMCVFSPLQMSWHFL